MGNTKEPQTVSIDGKEYNLDDFTQEQKAMLDHCMDLDRKIASCQFQFDQLRVGKDAFLAMLKKSLDASEEPAGLTD
jgi:cytochrome b involved in lipid metabolism